MNNRLDIIIFGATGVTGKYTIPPVEKLTKTNGRSLSWGVAGRSESKLKNILQEMSCKIGKDLSNIPIVIADVNDEKSLKNMTRQAKVIINTCGPYRLYGEAVIKACIATNTHHVDVSGEEQYMDTMQLKYNKIAMDKQIYLISACGFESIVTDLGVIFLQDKFKGTLNSVESYIENKIICDTKPEASGNIGSWESAVHVFGNYMEIKKIRSKLFPHSLPEFSPKLPFRWWIHKNNQVNNAWSLPLLGPDRSVVEKSQRHFYEHDQQRPVKIRTYMCINTILNIIQFAILGAIFVILSQFKLGQKLLIKYPKIFSLGFFSHKGPAEESMNNTEFITTLVGVGWDKKQEDCHKEFTTEPNKEIIAKIHCVNPGYGATTVALTLSAIKILEESSKMPNKGGVYPPGAAFARTSLIKELNENGLTFKLC